RCFLPLYGPIDREKHGLDVIIPHLDTPMERWQEPASLWQVNCDTTTYFVGSERYFDREGIYGYEDGGERYAQEICTPEYGERLDSFLRDRGENLHGLLNGIDDELFDPKTDPNLVLDFMGAIARGFELYRRPAAFRELALRCMSRDFSWGPSARKYSGLYAELAGS
ncbi:MAG: hypothetical protein QF719_06285, partial [Chloroflexota bacterium]|nr:hypothetical protein [Chloroflexota bacterium]